MKKLNISRIGVGRDHSLIEKAAVCQIIYGVVMILYAISDIFDSRANGVLSLITACCALPLLVFVILRKYEKDDEMSKTHRTEANSRTLKMLLLIILFVIIAGEILRYTGTIINVDLIATLLLIVGFILIYSGIMFIK